MIPETKKIHKAGRPPIVRPQQFYTKLLREYEVLTVSQMAKIYGVTRGTIHRWLRIAKVGEFDEK